MPGDELMHHGIDGQRWGVTHGPPYPLSRADHKRIIKSAESTEKRNLSYRKSRKFAKRMSDEDLNATIDRLRREETYRNLVSKDKQEKAIARKARALDRKVAKAQLKKLKKEQEIKENQNKPKKERFANTKELAMDAARIGVKTMATSGFAALAKALFPEEEKVPKIGGNIKDQYGNTIALKDVTESQYNQFVKKYGSGNVSKMDAAATKAANIINKASGLSLSTINAPTKEKYEPISIKKVDGLSPSVLKPLKDVPSSPTIKIETKAENPFKALGDLPNVSTVNPTASMVGKNYNAALSSILNSVGDYSWDDYGD